MELWRAVVLGVVQGLTEFLPISSSGHLVITEHLLGIDPPGVAFEVTLHLGTLLAVLIYFRGRILQILRDAAQRGGGKSSGLNYLLALVLGTIPAGIIGVAFKSQVESAFSAPRAAAGLLLVTGLLLISTLLIRRIDRPLTLLRAFIVGCAQAVALLPGISRSGSTISAAMWLGISPAQGAEFSFLLSIPAILGATALSLGETLAEGLSGTTIAVYAFGGLTAAMVGYASLAGLFSVIKKGRFWWFGIYCLAAGVAALWFLP